MSGYMNPNCKCCGKGKHVKEECTHRKRRCEICNRIGHLKEVCADEEAKALKKKWLKDGSPVNPVNGPGPWKGGGGQAQWQGADKGWGKTDKGKRGPKGKG